LRFLRLYASTALRPNGCTLKILIKLHF